MHEDDEWISVLVFEDQHFHDRVLVDAESARGSCRAPALDVRLDVRDVRDLGGAQRSHCSSGERMTTRLSPNESVRCMSYTGRLTRRSSITVALLARVSLEKSTGAASRAAL